jgi:hypothetical protein
MGFFKELREPLEIESRFLDHVPVVNGMSHQARKRILEKVKIPCRSLDVGQGRRIGRLKKVEVAATHQKEPKIPDELFMMVLAYSEEIHDLAVQIVQYLDGGRFLVEEHLSTAGECLDICLVRRKYLNDPLCETVLPTYV